MPKVMKNCRVCGKSYEACRTVSKAPGVFRWQEVACSPECGAIYLQKVHEARTGGADALKAAKTQESHGEKVDTTAGVVPLRLKADKAKTKSTSRK